MEIFFFNFCYFLNMNSFQPEDRARGEGHWRPLAAGTQPAL